MVEACLLSSVLPRFAPLFCAPLCLGVRIGMNVAFCGGHCRGSYLLVLRGLPCPVQGEGLPRRSKLVEGPEDYPHPNGLVGLGRAGGYPVCPAEGTPRPR